MSTENVKHETGEAEVATRRDGDSSTAVVDLGSTKPVEVASKEVQTSPDTSLVGLEQPSTAEGACAGVSKTTDGLPELANLNLEPPENISVVQLPGIESFCQQSFEIDSVFKCSNAEARKTFNEHQIPFARFMQWRSSDGLFKWIHTIGVSTNTKYPAVWTLMVMPQNERNVFLQSTGKATIQDNKNVRNVSQLVKWVKESCPTIMETFQRFSPRKPLNLTALLLMNRDEGEAALREEESRLCYEEFLKLECLGQAMTWMEKHEVVYVVMQPQLWQFMSIHNKKRRRIDHQLENSDARTTGGMINYLQRASNRHRKAAEHACMDWTKEQFYQTFANQVLTIVEEELNEIPHTIDKDDSIPSTVIDFGPIDMLHMMSEEQCITYVDRLSQGRVTLEEINGQYTLENLHLDFNFMNIKMTWPTSYFEKYWKCLGKDEKKRRELEQQDKIEVPGLIVIYVGDFIRWMYDTREQRKLDLEKRVEKKATDRFAQAALNQILKLEKHVAELMQDEQEEISPKTSKKSKKNKKKSSSATPPTPKAV